MSSNTLKIAKTTLLAIQVTTCFVVMLGSAFAAESVVSSPASYDFGSSAVSGSTPQVSNTFTYTFSGLSGSPASSLAYGVDFKQSAVACGGSSSTVCTVTIGFVPQSAGFRQDAIIIKDSTGTVLATTYLRGVGLAPQTVSYPGTMTAFAGTSAWNYAGDGGISSRAAFRTPMGLALDPLANLYIADSVNQVIRKITPTGIVSTVVGSGRAGYFGDGGAATGASLNGPIGVAVDGAGNLYIADQGNNVVRKVTAAGQISTLAGGATRSSGPDGWGDGGPATGAILNGPSDVKVDGLGNVFVADSYHHVVRQISASTGIISVVAGGGQGGGLDGIGDGASAISALLDNPTAIAFDSTLNLYIADSGHSLVRRVSKSSGMITAIAGNGVSGYRGDIGPATAAELSNPNGVWVDAAANVYIADTGNNAIRIVQAASGIINTLPLIASGWSATLRLANPTGIVMDSNGNIYFADTANNLIRIVSGLNPLLNFAAINVGQGSSSQTMALSNIGNQPFALSGITLSAGFQQESSGYADCAASMSLAAGTTCTVAISFVPSVTGAITGTLKVTGNVQNTSGTSETVATLSGTGVNGPVPSVSFSPTSLSFPAQTVAKTSAAQTVTLTNVGAAPLSISNIWLQGVNVQDFATSSTTCGPTLPAGSSCSVSVTFTPTAAGTRTASLSFSDSLSSVPQVVALSGTGVSAPVCTYTLGLTTLQLPAAGGAKSVAVTAVSGCSWTVQTAATWLGVDQLTPRSGPVPSLNFSVAPNNTTAARTGSLTIAGQTLTITQSAGSATQMGAGIGSYDLASSSDLSFAFDYNGSGKADHILLYRPGTGIIYILQNVAGAFSPVFASAKGIGGYDLMSPSDRIVAFDYDGSGKSDHLIFYRPGTGIIWILANKSGTFTPVYESSSVGGIGGFDLRSTSDHIVAYDYSGTGKQDHLLVYRPGTGIVWILQNSKGSFSPVYQCGWNASRGAGTGIGGFDLMSPNDQILPFDYFGTGLSDCLTIYRPGTGIVWILQLSNGSFSPVYQSTYNSASGTSSGIGGFDLMSTSDKLVAVDYNGTGKTDHLLIYRPGTGFAWIIEHESGNAFAPVYQSTYDSKAGTGNGIGGFDVSSASDLAFGFDYSSTGKCDHVALYRPGAGLLRIAQNNGGAFSAAF